MDPLCSGKPSCNYIVGSGVLYDLRPCGDLRSYLEISYECLPGKSLVTLPHIKAV